MGLHNICYFIFIHSSTVINIDSKSTLCSPSAIQHYFQWMFAISIILFITQKFLFNTKLYLDWINVLITLTKWNKIQSYNDDTLVGRCYYFNIIFISLSEDTLASSRTLVRTSRRARECQINFTVVPAAAARLPIYRLKS